MATYYVKNGGSDAADGLSDANAWETVAKVNAASFSAGDFVLFRGGDSWAESLTPPTSGSAGNPITFGSYGGGARPILHYRASPSGWQTPGNWTAVNGGAGTTYFGTLTEADATGGIENSSWGNKNTTYTCPGSGDQTLIELSVYSKSAGGTPGVIWLAIFDTSNNLIAQGSAAITVSSTSNGWYGHVGAANLEPAGGNPGDPITLTGGTNYRIYVSVDTADTRVKLTTVTSGNAGNVFVDYTSAGFPSSISPGDATSQPSVRGGIDATAPTTQWSIPLVFAAGFGPHRVFIDGVEYMQAASQGAVDATSRWHWASDVLTVYSNDVNPATAFTSLWLGTITKGSWGENNTDYDGALHLTKNYVNVTGLEFRGGWSSIDVNSANNCDISYCTFGMYAVYGADFRGTNTYVDIHDCIYDRVFDFPSYGVELSGDGIRIYGVSGSHSFCDLYNNTIQDAVHSGISLTAIYAGKTVTNCEVYNNTITGEHINYGRGADFTSTVLDAVTDNLFHDNIIHDVRTSALGVNGNGNKYYRNVIYNVTDSALGQNYAGGIYLSYNPNKICQDEEIYHNVVFNVDHEGIWLQADATHAVSGNLIKNNIIMNWGQDAGTWYAVHAQDAFVGANTFMNNLYFKTGVADVYNWNGTEYTVAEFEATPPASCTASGNLNADPVFADAAGGNFTLASSSPAINAGTPIAGINDGYRGSAPDMGAYERLGAGALAGLCNAGTLMANAGATIRTAIYHVRDKVLSR